MWHLRYLIKTFQHNSPRATQKGKGQKHSDLRKYLRSAGKSMMQDKLTRAIKVMHGWHKLSGILGGKIYPRKVHLFPLRHIHIGRNAIAKKYANIYI